MSNRFKYLFILFVGFFFFGGIPVEFGTEGAFFHGFMIPKPVIRVGLGTNLKDIRIRSSSGMKIYEVNTGYRIINDDADEAEIKGAGEKLTEKYVILLGHAKEREEADQLAATFRARFGGNIFVAADHDGDVARRPRDQARRLPDPRRRPGQGRRAQRGGPQRRVDRPRGDPRGAVPADLDARRRTSSSPSSAIRSSTSSRPIPRAS